MFAFIKNLKPLDVRLMMASVLCVIFLFASSTTPDGSGTCTSGFGTIRIVNETRWAIHVILYNPVEHTYSISKNGSTSDTIRAGEFYWEAFATREERDVGGAPNVYRSGKGRVKKDQKVTLLIDYLD